MSDARREIVGEFDPAMAPLLLSYGKALYELAFASQGVMGKEEVNKVATRPGMSSLRLAPMRGKAKVLRARRHRRTRRFVLKLCVFRGRRGRGRAGGRGR